MKLPTPRQYKKKYIIGEDEIELKFVRNMPESGCVGLWNPSTRIVYIKQKQTHAATFYTALHEAIHALSDEYDIGLTERQVRLLEKGIGDFLLTNL